MKIFLSLRQNVDFFPLRLIVLSLVCNLIRCRLFIDFHTRPHYLSLPLSLYLSLSLSLSLPLSLSLSLSPSLSLALYCNPPLALSFLFDRCFGDSYQFDIYHRLLERQQQGCQMAKCKYVPLYSSVL
jgi:hypothetical protein